MVLKSGFYITVMDLADFTPLHLMIQGLKKNSVRMNKKMDINYPHNTTTIY